MKKYVFPIILFVIAVLFNSQMDVIAFRPSQAWFDGWWIASNWQQPFWQKYLLPMSVDGWHLCKFIMLSSFAGIIALLTPIKKWYEWFLIMIAWGLLFNIFYSLSKG
jgi:hypothetical protein